jgi:dipeptidase E
MRLLLISNSGHPPFAHCAELMREFVGSSATLGFVTAANLGDEREYLSIVGERLIEEAVAKRVDHVDWQGDWRTALDSADAVLVGGGNTYALAERLAASGLGEAIGERVRGGFPYLGSSAGANMAGPNILTTNDWNVGGSTTFGALGLIGCNLNTHYLAGASEAPAAETREDRIEEFLIARNNPVVAIEEGTAIEVLDDQAHVRGAGRVRVFERNQAPRWLDPGDPLDTRLIEPIGNADDPATTSRGPA